VQTCLRPSSKYHVIDQKFLQNYRKNHSKLIETSGTRYNSIHLQYRSNIYGSNSQHHDPRHKQHAHPSLLYLHSYRHQRLHRHNTEEVLTFLYIENATGILGIVDKNVVQLIFRWFYAPKYKGARRFGNCNLYGRPKELEFAPTI
jgi:hypothetical protein